MSRLRTDSFLFPIDQAGPLLASLSGSNLPPSPAALLRWVRPGKRGVRLETCRVRGVRCTSLEAIRRFQAAVRERERAAMRADRELARELGED